MYFSKSSNASWSEFSKLVEAVDEVAAKFPYSWVGYTYLNFTVTVHKMTRPGLYGQTNYFQVQNVSCVSTNHDKAPAQTVDLWEENVRSVDGITRKEFEEALMHAMFTSPEVVRSLSRRPDTSPGYHSWIKTEDGHGVRSYLFAGTKQWPLGRWAREALETMPE